MTVGSGITINGGSILDGYPTVHIEIYNAITDQIFEGPMLPDLNSNGEHLGRSLCCGVSLHDSVVLTGGFNRDPESQDTGVFCVCVSFFFFVCILICLFVC